MNTKDQPPVNDMQVSKTIFEVLQMNEISYVPQEAASRQTDGVENSKGQAAVHSANAWEDIANLPKKPGPQANENDNLSFSVIYKDEDSITRCIGSSGPQGDVLKCKTENIEPLPGKPAPEKPTTEKPEPVTRWPNKPIIARPGK
ncbi:MAG: hypothetical protein IT342_24115 [Candidatus Melainabacteria bacterium]|nr:hypothetical protein [Candidatus Melainabacteria bacterium]